MSSTTTRFLLIRHGETEWNVARREMGQLDSPLTALGVAQAQRTGAALLARRPSAIYSSDLGRAQSTARIIASALKLEPIFDPRLRERHMGIFQGLTPEESEARHPVERRAYRADESYVIPGGESAAQRAERGFACIEELAEKHHGETVAVITHGGLLMGLLERMLELPPGSGRRFQKPNAAINSFVREDSGWRLESWGATAHLQDLRTK
ncbi:MAG TPA: histidine phosphatase family protein [Opitutaceae bacterium]|jgi:probable phosphoglycerate mutase